MAVDLYRLLPPKWYFNPKSIVNLERKVSELERMADEGPSLHIQREFRDARKEADTLSKKCLLSSLNGFGLVAVGLLGVTLNYMTPEEMKHVAEYAHTSSEIVNNLYSRGYMVFGGSLAFGAGTVHLFSRLTLLSGANDLLRKIKNIMIKLGYEKEKPNPYDDIISRIDQHK